VTVSWPKSWTKVIDGAYANEAATGSDIFILDEFQRASDTYPYLGGGYNGTIFNQIRAAVQRANPNAIVGLDEPRAQFITETLSTGATPDFVFGESYNANAQPTYAYLDTLKQDGRVRYVGMWFTDNSDIGFLRRIIANGDSLWAMPSAGSSGFTAAWSWSDEREMLDNRIFNSSTSSVTVKSVSTTITTHSTTTTNSSSVTYEFANSSPSLGTTILSSSTILQSPVPISGFPIEVIMTGLCLGLVLTTFVRRKSKRKLR